MRIEIMQDRRMKRPNGDAFLYFTTLEEVNEAMKYDRKYLGKTILFNGIEYFLENIFSRIQVAVILNFILIHLAMHP
jgi:hypothetical protein